ncbi:hypothetical protein Ddye_022900 [Dipteronia dyeriana]|uniref:Uncharacterized protein n=1 Tax=Dipteronia dyeriana TaxID=168575 RepID=A0AAD9TRY7_9ROSI|nr:hypothetical protein Ddye_022900 [Dipteronia dyeriana]
MWNLVVHGLSCGSPVNVIAWFQEFLAECNCVLEKETGSGIPGGIVEACRRLPDTCICKITDAALIDAVAMIWDHCGFVMATGALNELRLVIWLLLLKLL